VIFPLIARYFICGCPANCAILIADYFSLGTGSGILLFSLGEGKAVAKNFDELIRDIDLIIEHINDLRLTPGQVEKQDDFPVQQQGFDAFCEIFALKAVMRAFISSVDTIVKVQMANKVEQDIGHLESRVKSIGGEGADPRDVAQITAYVRNAVSELLD
jgi:hypothetical protein